MNSNKIILDLCGGSGAWSRPYKDSGYDVRVITLPEYDVCAYTPPEGVYGILAAPPCTEFSVAKGSRPRDFDGAMHIVAACLWIIWECGKTGSLKFWALENPRGLLRQFLGKPAYTFEQWEFGDRGIKPTDIWGYFNPPRKTAKERPRDPYFVKQYSSGKLNQFALANPECPEWALEYISKQPNKRAALRAITPPGFVHAFYKCNK